MIRLILVELLHYLRECRVAERKRVEQEQKIDPTIVININLGK